MRRSICAWCVYCTTFFLINYNLFSFNKYIINCDNDLKIMSFNIAMNEVGKIEENNNSGYVEKYLNSVDLNASYPYCMAGQYWSFDSALKKRNKLNIHNPLLKTGSAIKEYKYLKNKGRKSKFNLNKYDLVFWRKINSWQGHVERIIKVGKSGWIKTLAFNVKQANKEGVFIKKRNIFHPIGRLRFIGAIGFEENS